MAVTVDSELLDGGRLLPLVEDFYTIQGEGFHAGKPAYFIRLGGCDVGCRWCDAKYTWNPKLYPPTDVRTVIDRATACPGAGHRHHGRRAAALSAGCADPGAACKGVGDLSGDLGVASVQRRFRLGMPFAQASAASAGGGLRAADELKVIVESEADFEWAERNAARVSAKCRLYLQPEWSVAERVMPAMVEYAKANPRWNISIQTHKYMHIP